MLYCVFFLKHKSAYEMRISDWSSDVCSSDLQRTGARERAKKKGDGDPSPSSRSAAADGRPGGHPPALFSGARRRLLQGIDRHVSAAAALGLEGNGALGLGEEGVVLAEADVAARVELGAALAHQDVAGRSEEHTSELQSLMRISYAVFCLKKNKITHQLQ